MKPALHEKSYMHDYATFICFTYTSWLGLWCSLTLHSSAWLMQISVVVFTNVNGIKDMYLCMKHSYELVSYRNKWYLALCCFDCFTLNQ